MLQKIKNKRSKKYNVSELLNSKKTKKSKNIINSYVLDRQNKKNKQYGGFSFTIPSTSSGAPNIEHFKATGKLSYASLKRDVSRAILWAKLKQKGKFWKSTDKKKLIIHSALLKAHLFFTRMKIENTRMKNTLKLLIGNKDSGLNIVQTMIDEIFELQSDIDKGYLEDTSKGLDYDENNGSTTSNKKINKLIDKQDKIRKTLIKYTRFNSDNDLGKCTGSQGGLGTIMGNNERKIICLLRKFRKHEGKFNLYFNKFHNQYEIFIKASGCSGEIESAKLNFFSIEEDNKQMPSIYENTKCDKADIAATYDKVMEDLNKVDENSNKIQKQKNNKAALSKKLMEQASNFATLIKSFNERLGLFIKIFSIAEAYGIHHYKANIAKKVKTMSLFRKEDQRYLIKQENLTLLASDPVFIKEFTDIINNLEKTDPLLHTSTGTDEKNIETTIIPNIPILITSFADMKILSINFDKMEYDPDMNMNMWELLKLKNAGIFNNDYYDTPSILCIQNCDPLIVQDFELIIPNKDTFIASHIVKTSRLGIHTPSFEIANAIAGLPDEDIDEAATKLAAAYNPPLANNAIDAAAAATRAAIHAVAAAVAAVADLKVKYKLVAYSYHGAEKKHNAIFIKENVLGKDNVNLLPDEISKIKPVDQTSYFQLNYTPENMTPIETQKSFASVNLQLTPAAEPKFINLVTTELIGSDPENDLKHMIDINNFKNDQKFNDGLRGAQIRGMFSLIQKYKGITPDIICGDLGVMDNNQFIYSGAIQIVKDKNFITNSPDVSLNAAIIKFYTDGITQFPNTTYNKTPVTNQHFYTKDIDHTTSNYIFYKNTINIPPPPASAYGPQNIINIGEFGGILPIGIKLNIPNGSLHDIVASTQLVRLKKNTANPTKLYTEKELKDIIRMLDKLMGNFTYGYKPFLKRDLGCFSFDGDDIPDSERSPFSIRSATGKKDVEKAETLNTFYAMNYPCFIETYLYQLSGFFKNPSSGAVYYNENQIIFGKETPRAAKGKLRFFDKVKPDNVDIIARMLLIPSEHLKEISGIDIKDKSNIKSYDTLSQMFCIQYYRDVVQNLLEERLTKMEITSNNGLLAKLKEKDGEGNLVNIANPTQAWKLISRLYEYIFIMLKLKFIDYQIEKSIAIPGAPGVSRAPGTPLALAGKSTSIEAAMKAYMNQRKQFNNILKACTKMIQNLHKTYDEMLNCKTVEKSNERKDKYDEYKENLNTYVNGNEGDEGDENTIDNFLITILNNMQRLATGIKNDKLNNDIEQYKAVLKNINDIILMSDDTNTNTNPNWNKSIFKKYYDEILPVIKDIYDDDDDDTSYINNYTTYQANIKEFFTNFLKQNYTNLYKIIYDKLINYLTYRYNIYYNIPQNTVPPNGYPTILNNYDQQYLLNIKQIISNVYNKYYNEVKNFNLPDNYDVAIPLSNQNNIYYKFTEKLKTLITQTIEEIFKILQLENKIQNFNKSIENAKEWYNTDKIPDILAFVIIYYFNIIFIDLDINSDDVPSLIINNSVSFIDNLYDKAKEMFESLQNINQKIKKFDTEHDNLIMHQKTNINLLDTEYIEVYNRVVIDETIVKYQYAENNYNVNEYMKNQADILAQNKHNYPLVLEIFKIGLKYILAIDEYMHTIDKITKDYIQNFKKQNKVDSIFNTESIIKLSQSDILVGGGNKMNKFKNIKSNNKNILNIKNIKQNTKNHSQNHSKKYSKKNIKKYLKRNTKKNNKQNNTKKNKT